MDQAYLPTVGHMIGVCLQDDRPGRVRACLIESAHSILAGLDPADDMAYALYHDKLWSVHLNDQNGLKYDQDKVFGSVDLRRAFNQVWVLEKNGYGRNGDASASTSRRCGPRRSRSRCSTSSHSKTMFLRLLDIVRGIDEKKVEEFRAHRQYEQLEMLILNALMGRRSLTGELRAPTTGGGYRRAEPGTSGSPRAGEARRDRARGPRGSWSCAYIRRSRSSLTACERGVVG